MFCFVVFTWTHRPTGPLARMSSDWRVWPEQDHCCPLVWRPTDSPMWDWLAIQCSRCQWSVYQSHARHQWKRSAEVRAVATDCWHQTRPVIRPRLLCFQERMRSKQFVPIIHINTINSMNYQICNSAVNIRPCLRIKTESLKKIINWIRCDHHSAMLRECDLCN